MPSKLARAPAIPDSNGKTNQSAKNLERHGSLTLRMIYGQEGDATLFSVVRPKIP
jgi:hypothetical protein